MDIPLKTAGQDITTTKPYSSEKLTDGLILQYVLIAFRSVFIKFSLIPSPRILTEEHHWLSRNPQKFESTPYSRISHIQYTISPYARFDGTMTQFDIGRDGQMASYSMDGVSWHRIDYKKWSSLVFEIISRIRRLVSDQMPNGMTVSDLAGGLISDDLSKTAPHRQPGNKLHVEANARTFLEKMKSSTEGRHRLFHVDGTVNEKMSKKYVKQDQVIKGLLCTLLAASSPVPMRSWQFGSIVYESCKESDRNVWIVDGRFVTGKPRAKQLNLAFADALFWFPRAITMELIALLYYQQPFICSLLNGVGHLYASHIWALPLKMSRKTYQWVWSGREVNRSSRSLTQELIGSPVDPALMRQSSEGLLRNKIPTLFHVFQSRDNLHLEEGGYAYRSCLQSYANRHNLKALAHAADISVDRTSACLIVCDIWQCMHNVEEADTIWQPMVVGSYIFPTVSHDDLAYLQAQNQKMIINSISKTTFDQNTLTRGIVLLPDINAEVCVMSEES